MATSPGPASSLPASSCVRRLGQPTPDEIQALTELLIDCVEGGASISFMLPLSTEKARQFWVTVAAEVARGARVLLVVEVAGAIVGSVQLVLEQADNQRHRADVTKMLVRRSARRQGLGALLMKAVDTEALACEKALLVLDTASADAARLYEGIGWRRVGAIPGYALLPGGELCDTVFYYRDLKNRAHGR